MGSLKRAFSQALWRLSILQRMQPMPTTPVGIPSPSTTLISLSWLQNICLLDCISIRWHRWWLIQNSWSELVALDNILRGFLSTIIVSSVKLTCSASWILCGSTGHSLSRLIWQHTWWPHTVMLASPSTTDIMYMTSTSCPFLSMIYIQARFYSTHFPSWWKLYKGTGVGILLDGLWMTRRIWLGNTRAWSHG